MSENKGRLSSFGNPWPQSNIQFFSFSLWYRIGESRLVLFFCFFPFPRTILTQVILQLTLGLLHKYNVDRTVLFIVPCLQKTFPPSLIHFLLVPILTLYGQCVTGTNLPLICSCSGGSWEPGKLYFIYQDDASQVLAREWLNFLRLISWLFVPSQNHIKHRPASWNCITVSLLPR